MLDQNSLKKELDYSNFDPNIVLKNTDHANYIYGLFSVSETNVQAENGFNWGGKGLKLVCIINYYKIMQWSAMPALVTIYFHFKPASI